jgi:hypothetical protein
VRLQADFWATPTDTTMVQLSAYASGLDRRAWGRLALGHKIDRGLHLGPEIELYRQSGYDKLRVGVHLTDLAPLRRLGGYQRPRRRRLCDARHALDGKQHEAPDRLAAPILPAQASDPSVRVL